MVKTYDIYIYIIYTHITSVLWLLFLFLPQVPYPRHRKVSLSNSPIDMMHFCNAYPAEPWNTGLSDPIVQRFVWIQSRMTRPLPSASRYFFKALCSKNPLRYAMKQCSAGETMHSVSSLSFSSSFSSFKEVVATATPRHVPNWHEKIHRSTPKYHRSWASDRQAI